MANVVLAWFEFEIAGGKEWRGSTITPPLPLCCTAEATALVPSYLANPAFHYDEIAVFRRFSRLPSGRKRWCLLN
jgi:hypothetical protein